MKKTRLWYVGLDRSDFYKIVVSKRNKDQRFLMRIRKISANAAGRKYLRDNIPSIVASINQEWNHTGKWPTDELEQKQFKEICKTSYYQLNKFEITVDKT